MLSNNCSMMSHGNRNRQNELALVDEMGNTVGK